MAIVYFDTETTGLLEPVGTPLNLQPFITEIYAAKFTDQGKFLKDINSLVYCPIPIPRHITKLTGIHNGMTKKAPLFTEIYKKIAGVFLGCHTVVAHNLSFDLGIIQNELLRIGKELAFPWPPIHYCTVERSMHLKGRRLKNSELYKMATGQDMPVAHRAKIDVKSTFKSARWLMAGCPITDANREFNT